MRKSFILWVSALLLFSGCAVKTYETSEPKLITFKSQKLRFNDVGYIRISGSAVQAELFSAGQAVERFEIDGKICVSEGCLSKSSFNRDYLSPAYPDTLLQNVLRGRPIFGGRELQRSEEGFEQKFKAMAVFNITYRVTAEEIYFKDPINGILIKIREIPEVKK